MVTTHQLLQHDALVLAMADRNHVPEEIVLRNADGHASCHVVCEQCGAEWPCWIRVKVDAAKADHLRKARDDIGKGAGRDHRTL